MMSYNEASQYIEDNYYTKSEESEKYYCGDCKKITLWHTTSGFNGDSWTVIECETCGAGDEELYEDKQDYNNNN